MSSLGHDRINPCEYASVARRAPLVCSAAQRNGFRVGRRRQYAGRCRRRGERSLPAHTGSVPCALQRCHFRSQTVAGPEPV